MHRLHRAISVAGLALAPLLGAACFEDDFNDVVGPRPVDPLFGSYVALGSSITAGFQSSGITEATQRQSFAFLLAQQMRARFAFPAMALRGCNPPVTNFQQQTGGTTQAPITAAARPTICDLRVASSATAILNNVAVPGSSSLDPTDADGTQFSNPLTTLILGGGSQVQRALEARPTFASIWIGNNDVLGFAVADGRTTAPPGFGLAGMTTAAQFQTNYDAMINALLAGAPDLEGILIGVVNVVNAPVMFPAAALSNAAFKTGFDAVAGTVTVLDASCAPGGAGAASLINTFLAFQIRALAHPPTVACVPGGQSGALPAPIGDILVLDQAEQGIVASRVTAYNTYLSAKASSLGWAYYDPNPLLTGLKSAGVVVRPVPNWIATTADAFGTGMSLDGVHLGPSLHRTLANDLLAAINGRYSTTLAPVP